MLYYHTFLEIKMSSEELYTESTQICGHRTGGGGGGG